MLEEVNKSNSRSTSILVWFTLFIIFFGLIPTTKYLSYFLLACYALIGKKQAIQSLALCWLFNILNPAISPTLETSGILRYVVVISAFVSVFFRTNYFKFDKIFFNTFLLITFLLFHSIFFSKMLDVSILKVINWSLVIFTLILAFSKLNYLELNIIKNWLFSFFLLIFLTSLPLIFIPEIGYAYTRASGFQGILNHPQAFGPTMSIFAIVILTKLTESQSNTLILIILFFLSVYLIIISESRTAGFALFLSMTIYYLIYFFKKKKFFFISKIKRKKFIILLFSLLVIIAFFFTNLKYVIEDFKVKGTDAENVLSAYQKSRSILYDPMISNIIEKPLVGIGFGIASNIDSMQIKRDPIFNLPYAAATEKGILPIMVLEEIGLLGFIIFMIWIIYLIFKTALNNFNDLMLLLNLLLLNMGEAMFFSPGGFGLIVIIMFVYCLYQNKLKKKYYPKNINQ